MNFCNLLSNFQRILASQMVVKYFDVAVQAIFKNWTALQLLVNNVRPTIFMCGKNLYEGEGGGGDGGGGGEGGAKA